MYLLDTNHVSKVLQGHPGVYNRFARVGSENVSIPFVVCGELLYMAHKSERKEQNLQTVHRFLDKIRIIHSDLEACGIYGDLKEAFIRRFGPKQLKKRSAIRLYQIGVDDNDLWIAATAIRHNLTLVSADSDFERIRAVCRFSLETWWRPEQQGFD
jgi:tRNA(fMet)-specific endonuclease VapC